MRAYNYLYLIASLFILHGCANMVMPVPESFEQAIFAARQKTFEADKYITVQISRVPPRYTKAKAKEYASRIDAIDKDIDDLEAVASTLSGVDRSQKLDAILLLLLKLEGETK